MSFYEVLNDLILIFNIILIHIFDGIVYSLNYIIALILNIEENHLKREEIKVEISINSKD